MLKYIRGLAQKFLLDWQQREALEKILHPEKFECLDIAIQFICWNQIPGDYLEFGCYSGKTFRAAESKFREHRRNVTNFLSDKDKAEFCASSPRLFAFDSFQGLPPPGGVDAHPYTPKHWKEATFSMSYAEFESALVSHGADMSSIRIVDGWYENTLSEETRRSHELQLVSLVNIDCDLYESTALCLDFITPLIQDGTVILFDDYNFYRGSPHLGERRAFREWLEKNGDISATELARQGFDKVAFFLNRTGDAVSSPSPAQ